ncbi:MAG: tRNA dihydrouridine synthase [Phycisphaerae bacterium]
MQIQAMKIGSLTIDFPVVLAPLAGYSDLAYRTIVRRLGCEFCTTEMMLDKCVLVTRRKKNPLIATDDLDHPCGGQLIGNEPKTMAAAAVKLQEMGFDLVDLNFGCPVHKARKRRRGGYMMTQPDRVVAIAEAVVRAVDIPVTVKVRQKFENDENHEAFYRLADGCRDAGADAIIVHARSVEQKYAGQADWDFLREVRSRYPDWTVLGSGDILDPAHALRMLDETGMDAALAARGAIGNPWFFRQAKDLAAGRQPYQPDLAEQKEVLLEHMNLAVELYGPEKGPKIMRKHGIKYARMHPHPKQLRMAFVEVKSPEDWMTVVENYYG